MRNLSEIVTSMGHASAKAQCLKQVITTFERFVGTDNRIYLKVDGNKVLGMLKVGEKNLFYRDYVLSNYYPDWKYQGNQADLCVGLLCALELSEKWCWKGTKKRNLGNFLTIPSIRKEASFEIGVR